MQNQRRGNELKREGKGLVLDWRSDYVNQPLLIIFEMVLTKTLLSLQYCFKRTFYI